MRRIFVWSLTGTIATLIVFAVGVRVGMSLPAKSAAVPRDVAVEIRAYQKALEDFAARYQSEFNRTTEVATYSPDRVIPVSPWRYKVTLVFQDAGADGRPQAQRAYYVVRCENGSCLIDAKPEVPAMPAWNQQEP